MSGQGGEGRGGGQASEHVRQFLAWVAERPRTYAESMEAWRTSCPRLSAWEDALADDLIRVDASGAASHGRVRLTEKGEALSSSSRSPDRSAPGVPAGGVPVAAT